MIIYCCKECGNKISRPSAIYGNGRCTICYHKSRLGKELDRKSYKGKNNPNYKGGKLLKKYYCKCGNKVSLHNGVYGSCTCQKCRTLNLWKNGNFKKRNFVGKNNPNYVNGQSKSKYSNYFRKIRLSIRTRDNFKCKNCGITENTHIKKFKEVLSIHHIDYNKQNCKENNLITTCKLCNIKANFNRDYWYAFYTYKMENK